MTPDLAIARQCLRFADLAYSAPNFSDAASSTQGAFGGWVDQPKRLIIAFAGTADLKDVLRDAKFTFKARFPWHLKTGARVHRGFLDGYLAEQKNIWLRAQDATEIYLTGHSLGGAEAMCCALDLHRGGFPVAGVHVFGCPRVGNGEWRDLYNANLHDITFRWEAQGDPVPFSPPLAFNYRHAGRGAYLKNDGRVIVEPSLWEHMPAFVETLGRAESSFISGLIHIFDPHKLANYKELFAKLT